MPSTPQLRGMNDSRDCPFDRFGVDHLFNSTVSFATSNLGAKCKHLAPVRKYRGAVYGRQAGHQVDGPP